MNSIKRVMVFYRENFCYDLVNSFTDMCIDGLRANGVEVDTYDFITDVEKSATILAEKLGKGIKYDAAIAYDAIGQQDIELSDGKNLFDVLGIPFFDRLLDPPYLLSLNAKCRNFYVLNVDKDHVEFTKENFPDVKDSFFLPHSAYFPDKTEESFEEFCNREYPVVFTGSLLGIDNMIEKYINKIPAEYRPLTLEIIEYLLDNRSIPLEEGFLKLIRKQGYEGLNGDKRNIFLQMISVVDLFVRQYVREELLQYIVSAGVPIHIWGGGEWKNAEWLKDSNAVFHGLIEYGRLPAVFGKARLILNCMPWFRNGSHDRIPGGMFNGAAVLTDHSKYLDELFACDTEESRKLFFYDIDHPENVSDIIFDLLDEPERMYRAVRQSRQYSREYMTPKAVAKQLLEIMELVRNRDF